MELPTRFPERMQENTSSLLVSHRSAYSSIGRNELSKSPPCQYVNTLPCGPLYATAELSAMAYQGGDIGAKWRPTDSPHATLVADREYRRRGRRPRGPSRKFHNWAYTIFIAAGVRGRGSSSAQARSSPRFRGQPNDRRRDLPPPHPIGDMLIVRGIILQAGRKIRTRGVNRPDVSTYRPTQDTGPLPTGDKTTYQKN